MKKRLIALVMTLCMAAALVVPASAVSGSSRDNVVLQRIGHGEYDISSETNQEQLTVLEIKDDVFFRDQRESELLFELDDDISEVIYTVDCGDRVLTIGYLPGHNKFDYEDMRSSVPRMLESMLKDLNNEKRTDYSVNQIENLQLKEIRLQAGVNADIFLAERYSNSVEKVCNIQPAELIEDSISSTKATTNNSITGSYHYRQQINDQTSILKWFNQATNTSSNCTVTPTKPHAGDGNTRYRNGNYQPGYKWYPTNVKTYFRNNSSSGKNKCRLIFSYNPTQLGYLKKDNNEALELSIVFYNYTDYGYTYMKHTNITYGTDQPTGYLDTSFGDDSNEVDFCVGVRNANQLSANKDYYWWIESKAGDRPSNRPKNGQFKVMAQRSYSILNPAPSSLAQWFVFGEEHEDILRLKTYPTGNTAWTLGTSGNAWKFNAATDSVS